MMARYYHVTFVVLALLHETTVSAFSLCSNLGRGNAIASSRCAVNQHIAALRVGKNDNDGEDIQADDNNDNESFGISRRHALVIGMGTAVSLGVSQQARAIEFPWTEDQSFRPAPRPLAYRVDSTIPPTLLPLNARSETAILKNLGRGSGTPKEAVQDDRVNFNNMLNKAVFGTIAAVSSLTNPQKEDSKFGPGYASFLCMGVPKNTTSEDIGLSVSVLTSVMQGRKSQSDTAVGLAFAPLSTQTALDAYSKDGNEQALVEAMTKASVSEYVVQLYLPLLQFAQSRSLALLALAPEAEDVGILRSKGLQNVDVSRRAQYVADSDGFIKLTQDPKFRLYTDRSLFKDFKPQDKSDNEGNFFAERILVHEAAATAVARYATSRPDSLVAVVAPTPDVRFLGGINGRIPRVCEYFNKELNKVNEEAVTTMLLNPTAKVRPLLKFFSMRGYDNFTVCLC